MIELVSGIPAPQLGTNLREYEDQSGSKFKRFRKMISRTEDV
jgi:hypothetical protein